MSCASKGYGKSTQSNDYLNAQFYFPFVNNSALQKNGKKYRKYIESYPSFTPILNGLSITSSPYGVYTVVYVSGSNFLPNGTTFIQFGSSIHLPVIYYNSFSISFVVPPTIRNNYSVRVVNIYNGNFSAPVNQSYPGNLNYSSSIDYAIT